MMYIKDVSLRKHKKKIFITSFEDDMTVYFLYYNKIERDSAVLFLHFEQRAVE